MAKNQGLEPNKETPEYLQQLGVGVVSKLSEELNDVKKAALSVTDEQMNDHITNLLTSFLSDEHMNDLDVNGSSSVKIILHKLWTWHVIKWNEFKT